MDIIVTIHHILLNAIHLLPFLAAHIPFDVAIGILSFLSGLFVARRGALGLMIQASLLLMKMAKHYYDTHPEARERFKGKERIEIESKITKLETHHRELKTGEETGALG